MAGGLELALCGDLRVGATNSYYGIYNRRFGIPLIDGGTYRLPRVIGQGIILYQKKKTVLRQTLSLKNVLFKI